MLSSERLGIVAKMDLIESTGERVTPVDYKRGRPCESPDGLLTAWDPDRVQLAAQALILRDHGYPCEEGIIYYAKTKQRVRVPIDEALVAQTVEVIEQARMLAAGGQIPPPLVDSPKCPPLFAGRHLPARGDDPERRSRRSPRTVGPADSVRRRPDAASGAGQRDPADGSREAVVGGPRRSASLVLEYTGLLGGQVGARAEDQGSKPGRPGSAAQRDLPAESVWERSAFDPGDPGFV